MKEDKEGIEKIKIKSIVKNTETTLNHMREKDQHQERIGKEKDQDRSSQQGIALNREEILSTSGTKMSIND